MRRREVGRVHGVVEDALELADVSRHRVADGLGEVGGDDDSLLVGLGLRPRDRLRSLRSLDSLGFEIPFALRGCRSDGGYPSAFGLGTVCAHFVR